MANIKSAQKRARQTIIRTARNKVYWEQIKQTRKALVASITNKDGVEAAFQAFSKRVDKAAKLNIIHKNKAARFKSRYAKLLYKKA